MNSFILLSLLASVIAGKSPRLKFVVHEPSRFHFNKPENYISMYHQEGSDTLYVGGQAMIYVLTFTNRGVRDLQIPAASDQTAIDTCKAKAAPLEVETHLSASPSLLQSSFLLHQCVISVIMFVIIIIIIIICSDTTVWFVTPCSV